MLSNVLSASIAKGWPAAATTAAPREGSRQISRGRREKTLELVLDQLVFDSEPDFHPTHPGFGIERCVITFIAGAAGEFAPRLREHSVALRRDGKLRELGRRVFKARHLNTGEIVEHGVGREIVADRGARHFTRFLPTAVDANASNSADYDHQERPAYGFIAT